MTKMVTFEIHPRPHLLILNPKAHLGGHHPSHVPLFVIELRNKDQRKVWGALNPAITDLTTLGHILALPGQVKNVAC